MMAKPVMNEIFMVTTPQGAMEALAGWDLAYPFDPPFYQHGGPRPTLLTVAEQRGTEVGTAVVFIGAV
jgi:hypothetical protein